MPVGAVIGAAVIGGGSQIIAGNKASGAVKDAAKQTDTTNRYIYDQTRADYTPYREVGYGALGKLASMYGVQRTAADGTAVGAPAGGGEPYGGFQTSPGYQFRVDEAMKAIERSAAARGGLRSGATMDALQRRVQGEASSEYERYADRLAQLAGVGQSATGSTAAAGANYAQQQGQTNMATGNARASAYQNTGSAINSGIQNVAGMYLYSHGLGPGGVAGGFGGYGSNETWPRGLY